MYIWRLALRKCSKQASKQEITDIPLHIHIIHIHITCCRSPSAECQCFSVLFDVYTCAVLCVCVLCLCILYGPNASKCNVADGYCQCMLYKFDCSRAMHSPDSVTKREKMSADFRFVWMRSSAVSAHGLSLTNQTISLRRWMVASK